jgi:hypothetical protein
MIDCVVDRLSIASECAVVDCVVPFDSVDVAYKLPTIVKMLYAGPMFGNAGLGLFISGFMAKFYSDDLHLDLGVISVIQFLGGIFGKFTWLKC